MSRDSVPTELYVTTPEHTVNVWNDFVGKFKYEHYLISQDHDLIANFVDSLLENVQPIRKHDIFYRARVNNRLPYERFKNDELGSPPANRTNSGRFNPQEIPHLYMASDVKTAVSEVLPFISAKVDIAKCTLLSKMELWDITKDGKNDKVGFRALLTKEFSKPVNPYRAETDYMPTQYIAEYCRRKGLDGIKYQSVSNPSGYNICLFSRENVDIVYNDTVTVNKICVDYK